MIKNENIDTLLDNTLTNYLHLLDILGFDINIKVSLNGTIIKQTAKGVKIK